MRSSRLVICVGVTLLAGSFLFVTAKNRNGANPNPNPGNAAPGPPAPGNNLGNGPPASLKTVTVPQPDLSGFLRSDPGASVALKRLGKALFWDLQAGGDGRQACASCHFHAGADHRLTNQYNPGPNGAFESPHAANSTAAAAEFPLRLPATDDRFGSAGLRRLNFTDVSGTAADIGTDAHNDNPAFVVNGIPVRQSTGRNTPTAINAVFNDRNFWDSRANFNFNGSSPFGNADSAARILVVGAGDNVTASPLSLSSSSAASQAVGPPNNPVEMSYNGRTWPKLGKKMLGLTPLGKQQVDPSDSLLGAVGASPSVVNTLGNGLTVSYASLIQAAFQDKYWNSAKKCTVTAGVTSCTQAGPPSGTSEYTVMEANFSLFWGLAVQAYESTLVSDSSRYDQFREGNLTALTTQEQTGLNVFTGKGRCLQCHSGPEFTSAAVTTITALGRTQLVSNQLADTGYSNIGVSPTADDIGLGGNNAFGNPLALSGGNFTVGAVKTPSLRNVEFTGPYMHNGSISTLEGVVDFYTQGGFFADAVHKDPRLTPVAFNATDRANLVAFLKALSDDRVRFQKRPFDHPSLCVANGHTGLSLTDNMVLIPATGANGTANPLQTFDELLNGVSAGKANNLQTPCP